MIKSMRMRLVGHLARKGKKRNAYRILVGKREGNRAVDQDVGRRRITKLSQRDRMACCGLDSLG
jgi:hypothetical protein